MLWIGVGGLGGGAEPLPPANGRILFQSMNEILPNSPSQLQSHLVFTSPTSHYLTVYFVKPIYVEFKQFFSTIIGILKILQGIPLQKVQQNTLRTKNPCISFNQYNFRKNWQGIPLQRVKHYVQPIYKYQSVV